MAQGPSRRFVRANLLTAELLLEAILNVNHAECEHITSMPVIGDELAEDFLGLPKTTRRTPSNRFSIIDGKTSIRSLAFDSLLTTKKLKIY